MPSATRSTACTTGSCSFLLLRLLRLFTLRGRNRTLPPICPVRAAGAFCARRPANEAASIGQAAVDPGVMTMPSLLLPRTCLLVAWLIAWAIVPAYSQADTKRGIAGSLAPRENAMNARWSYNWGNNLPDTVDDLHGDFVPMIWAAGTGGVQNQINNILSYKDQYNVEYVLGFNEPERQDQANMSVQQAIDVWDIMTDSFAGTGIQLVSPAVSGSGGLNNWFTPFMDEVELRNSDANPDNDLQIDAIAIHWYSTGNNPIAQANNILNRIDQLWADYGKPIWLTEFAGVDFSAQAATETKVDFNIEFLEYIIPQLEARDHVARYAWWQFGIGGKPYSQLSSVEDGVYTPTAIGDQYVGTLQAGESYDFATGVKQPTDVHYLRGATLTNTGPAIGTAARALDALEGDNTIAGTADWSLAGGADAFVRVRASATLEKLGTSNVRLAGVPLINHGIVRVSEGTLSLEAGSATSGDGLLRLEAGGTLSLGESGGTGASLDQPTELAGGTIQSQPLASGLNALRQTNTVEATTTFSGAGNLSVLGQLVGPSSSRGGGIVKSGTGTLYLAGNNSYQGGTSIQQGSLLVANPTGSATGSGSVEVLSGASLGGTGAIAGNVTVAAGGSLQPGIAESNLGITQVPAIRQGAVGNAIDFDFTGIQDDAPLTQVSFQASALELVSGFDFGPGLFARNAANNGDEFNVAGFSTGDVYGDARNADDYLTFTVAPAAGLAMMIDDVTYEIRRNGSGAATNYRVMTSLDGYEFDQGLQPDLTIDAADTTTHTYTASYNGSELTTDPVEIRLYGWNASSSFGNTHIYGVSLDASFVSDPDHIALQPTGVLQLDGAYTQLDFAILEIEIASASEFDQLMIAGTATLDGVIDVSLIDYVPGSNQQFTVLTASNIVDNGLELAGAEAGLFNLIVTDTSVVLQAIATGLPGDYNGDSRVDAADFTVWRDSLGQTGAGLAADGDSDGDVDIDDFLYWRDRFGDTELAEAQATPEPAAGWLALLTITSGAVCRLRR